MSDSKAESFEIYMVVVNLLDVKGVIDVRVVRIEKEIRRYALRNISLSSNSKLSIAGAIMSRNA